MATSVEQRPIFILTHRRPRAQRTLSQLRKIGTRVPIYLVVDNEDPTLPEYRQLNENLLVFSKKDYLGDTLLPGGGHLSSVVYARRAVYDLARGLGVTHFIMMDDDYKDFEFLLTRNLAPSKRYTVKLGEGERFDAILAAHWRFFDRVPVALLAMLQPGDVLGGKRNPLAHGARLHRKAMNVLFCSTERPVWFRGVMNEDVNTYLWLGMNGQLVFSTNFLLACQAPTQNTPGGATDMYLELGNHAKSYSSVLINPSAVKVVPLYGSKYRRLHHKILWRYAVPHLIGEEWKK